MADKQKKAAPPKEPAPTPYNVEVPETLLKKRKKNEAAREEKITKNTRRPQVAGSQAQGHLQACRDIRKGVQRQGEGTDHIKAGGTRGW